MFATLLETFVGMDVRNVFTDSLGMLCHAVVFELCTAQRALLCALA